MLIPVSTGLGEYTALFASCVWNMSIILVKVAVFAAVYRIIGGYISTNRCSYNYRIRLRYSICIIKTRVACSTLLFTTPFVFSEMLLKGCPSFGGKLMLLIKTWLNYLVPSILLCPDRIKTLSRITSPTSPANYFALRSCLYNASIGLGDVNFWFMCSTFRSRYSTVTSPCVVYSCSISWKG